MKEFSVGKPLTVAAAFLVFSLIALIAGCPSAPTTQPSPVILPPSLSVAETIALEVVQFQINAALANGKITQPQYDAVEGLLVQAYNDVQKPAGVTQADLDALVTRAVAAAIALELPISPIPASAQAKTFVPVPMTASTKAMMRK